MKLITVDPKFGLYSFLFFILFYLILILLDFCLILLDFPFLFYFLDFLLGKVLILSFGRKMRGQEIKEGEEDHRVEREEIKGRGVRTGF